MALLFVDSFDHYTTAQRLRKWSQTSDGATGSGGSIAIGAYGRRGTNGIRMHGQGNGGNSGYVVKSGLPVVGGTFIAGFALRWTGSTVGGFGGLYVKVLSILRASTEQIVFRLNTAGSGGIEVISGSTTIDTAPLPAEATLIFVEIKVVIHPTAGSIEIRYNNTPVLSLVDKNTAADGVAGWNGVSFGVMTSAGGSAGPAIDMDLDDLYLCDGNGSAPWNDFLGDIRIDAKYPTGAGATAGWTPAGTAPDGSATAGENWKNVDDTPPNDDTDHNTAVTEGLIDTFPIPDAAPGVLIYGVQFNFMAKKTDAGLSSIAPVARIGGVDYVGVSLNPGTTYTNLASIVTLNPATGVMFTEAEFNAAEFGYKRP